MLASAEPGRAGMKAEPEPAGEEPTRATVLPVLPVLPDAPK